jgi:hypothetical protein
MLKTRPSLLKKAETPMPLPAPLGIRSVYRNKCGTNRLIFVVTNPADSRMPTPAGSPPELRIPEAWEQAENGTPPRLAAPALPYEFRNRFDKIALAPPSVDRRGSPSAFPGD